MIRYGNYEDARMAEGKKHFVMDMIHDNPGEAPFETAFRKPEKLIEYGFNTQVYKYFDTTVPFKTMKEDFFDTEEAKAWLEKKQKDASEKCRAAHEAGLMTMCHVDVFVLPKKLVEKYQDEICDENGKISIFKEKTKEIYRILLNELFEMYPLDGLIIRVGETYLHDTPHHTGNGAVPYGDKEQEKGYFVELIKFLREEVCIRHNKYLVFRTWDCFTDRFHSNTQYYLDVTNRIDTHDYLFFSIKHTALDFWRRVKFNPCIGKGKHRQVIEVQCQREYEGKGAYPMYVMDGVINSFSEMKEPKGLKDVMAHPLVCGIYAWSRGGGWYGPYIKNEFWCDLNAYVIGKYGNNPKRTEEEIFMEYAREKMGMDTENTCKFHELCKKAAEAVLKGRYVEAYDSHLNEERIPCENWLRDNRIAGLRQLNVMFDYLEKNGLVWDAILEKEESVTIWKEIREDFKQIQLDNSVLREFIENSIEYGVRFFTIIKICFHIFAKCRRQEGVKQLLEEYDKAWISFKELEQRPQSSTSYCEEYLFSPNNLGLNETIAYCREHLSCSSRIKVVVPENSLMRNGGFDV